MNGPHPDSHLSPLGGARKKGNPESLAPALRAELAALEAMPDSAIDLPDPECPPMTEAELSANGIRGAFLRPIKKPVGVR
jgi:hypothetical protein